MWIVLFPVLLSAIVNVQTQSCVIGSVGTVEVTQVTAFNATVQWGGQATGACAVLYNVCWTLTSSETTVCLPEPTNQTSATVGELVPCNNYTIQVNATEVGGTATESGVTTARTIPRSPFFLNVTETGPSEARLFWLYLFFGNDCADQFLITWMGEGDIVASTAYAPTNVIEYTISNLASCTNYNFSLSTLDSDLNPSEPLSVYLKTDMLSGVLGVNVVDAVEFGAFDVTWTRPSDSPNSACEHWWDVCWGPVSGQQVCIDMSSATTTTRLASTGACTEHNVSVSTVSQLGGRHTPFWIIHVTPSYNETVISDVHVMARTQESVQLHWEPLYQGLPCAMAYRLCWTRAAAEEPTCLLLHTDVTSHNVTGLQPRSLYTFQLVVLFDTDDFSESFNLTVSTDLGSGGGAGSSAEISLAALMICLVSLLIRTPSSH